MKRLSEERLREMVRDFPKSEVKAMAIEIRQLRAFVETVMAAWGSGWETVWVDALDAIVTAERARRGEG